MAQTVVLITGANRGLGLGLAQRYLRCANHIIIAPVRNPQHETAKALADLPKGEGTSLIVPATKYDAIIEHTAFDVVKELVDLHSIQHLDIVIANAGGGFVFPLVKDVKRKDLMEHMELNGYSVVSLYQATRDLLESSSKEPIYAMMGSRAGSLGNHTPLPSAAYGPAKCTLPWYALRISAEDEWLNSFVMDPGFAQTEGANVAAEIYGMGKPPITVDESTDGMFKVLKQATKETLGGKVVLFTGEVQVY